MIVIEGNSIKGILYSVFTLSADIVLCDIYKTTTKLLIYVFSFDSNNKLNDPIVKSGLWKQYIVTGQ